MSEMMKKEKNPLILSIFLLALGIIAGGLLALVNSVTLPVINQHKQEALERELASVNVSSPVEVELASYLDNVNAIYSGKVDGVDVYVVATENKNKYTTVSVLVVVSKDGSKVLNASISGTPKITTHGFDESFTLDALHIVDATSSESITKITGATVSTGSVQACVEAALNQVKTIGGSI